MALRGPIVDIRLASIWLSWRNDVFTFELGQMMHRHGSEWAEMTRVAEHSPDAGDPERRLLRGEQVYRCAGCDEEMAFIPPERAR